MAKLTRVPAKVFAASAAADEIGQFGSAVAGSKLETADVATIQGLSAWLDGWSEALVSGNRYPALQEMNGLLKVLSYQGAYALQEGIPEYDSATTYYIGSIVKKTGTFELYGSLINDNVGQTLVDGANWKKLVDLNTVGQNITQIGACSTASATAEKDVILSGFVLATGATIQVTFTNANTADTPTLNVNSTGAKNIYDLKGNQITGAYFSNAANEQCLFRYDGTNWVLVTANFWSARMGMPSDSYIGLTLGASGATYVAPADGYYNLNKISDVVGRNIYISNNTTGIILHSYASLASGRLTILMPVKKNDVIAVGYDTTGATIFFKFVYAEGSKP